MGGLGPSRYTLGAMSTHTPGSFCWFELATTDQHAAKALYTQIFGWDVHDSPMGPGEVYTMFRLGGQDAAAAYTLRPEQRAQGVPPHWMIYVLVKSADETAARAKALGGTVIVEPFDVMEAGRMSVLRDPTGATFTVWQAIKHTGTGAAGAHGTAVWADLSTPDQARAGKFYADLFGWKMAESKSMAPAKPGDYYHIVNGKDFIGGIPPSAHRDPNMPPHWLIYFDVADCDRTIAQVTSLGGRVVMPAMTMGNVRRFAILADAQGAIFAIVQSLGGEEHPARPAAKATRAARTKRAKPARKANPVRKARPRNAVKSSKKKASKPSKKKARKPGKRRAKRSRKR
jgi:hypothetical protein